MISIATTRTNRTARRQILPHTHRPWSRRRRHSHSAPSENPSNELSSEDLAAEQPAPGPPGAGNLDERAALWSKLDSLKRWATDRHEPVSVDAHHAANIPAEPQTAIERKMELLDRAARYPAEAKPAEVPGTMTQEEFWQNHPDEYVPPDRRAPRPDVPEAFHDPREWVGKINPEPDTPGRDVNCGECARATELSWRGVPAVSARIADPMSSGEPDDRMHEWSGRHLEPMSLSEIGNRPEEAGDGASALVAVSWPRGGGHWFNAVNYNGEVLSVDGQGGTVESWPPTRKVTRLDEKMISESLAITFDRDGRII